MIFNIILKVAITGVVHQSHASTKMMGQPCVTTPQLSRVDTKDVTVECVMIDGTTPVNLAINVFSRGTSAMVVHHCVMMVLMLPPAVQTMMISVLLGIHTLNVLLISQHIKNVITVITVTKTTGCLTASLEVTRQILRQRKSW